jgi:hypothetical protein
VKLAAWAEPIAAAVSAAGACLASIRLLAERAAHDSAKLGFKQAVNDFHRPGQPWSGSTSDDELDSERGM